MQPLPLTDEQEQNLIAKLEYDIIDEDIAVRVRPLLDNCTTRVRDILDDATGGKLRALNPRAMGSRIATSRAKDSSGCASRCSSPTWRWGA